MMKLQRVRDGNLEFGIVVLSFTVQMDPDAGHGEGVCGLRFVDVRDRNTLHRKHNQLTSQHGNLHASLKTSSDKTVLDTCCLVVHDQFFSDLWIW